MLPLLWLGGLAGGAGLAQAAAEPLEHSAFPAQTRYFLVVAAYGASTIAPVGLVLYALYPDWALMYLANPIHLPMWLIVPVILVVGCLAPVAGFLGALRLLAAHRPYRVLPLGAFLAIGVLLIFGWGRLGLLGHYEAFHHGGTMIPFLASEAMLPTAIVVPVTIAAYALMRRQIRRHLKAMATFDDDDVSDP